MSKPKRRMQLANPCDNRWEDLEPRAGGRFCPECERVVVDMMHLDARDAWRRFDEAGGDLCVRIRESARGDAVFRHEPKKRHGVGAAVLSAALAAACGGETETPEPSVEPETTQTEATPEPPIDDTEEQPHDDFHVLDETDGSDHPAHDGEAHAAEHHVRHGRMGGARAVRHNGEHPDDDPLSGLDGL